MFDEAFKSRIHIALYYPPLSLPQTTRIWDLQIRRTRERKRPIQCDKDDLLRFATELFDRQEKNIDNVGPVRNGRQIRNAFQSAIALARYRPSDKRLVEETPEHFGKVARVSNEFNDYLFHVHRAPESSHATRNMLRYDGYGMAPTVAPQPTPGPIGVTRQTYKPAASHAPQPQYNAVHAQLPMGVPFSGMSYHPQQMQPTFSHHPQTLNTGLYQPAQQAHYAPMLAPNQQAQAQYATAMGQIQQPQGHHMYNQQNQTMPNTQQHAQIYYQQNSQMSNAQPQAQIHNQQNQQMPNAPPQAQVYSQQDQQMSNVEPQAQPLPGAVSWAAASKRPGSYCRRATVLFQFETKANVGTE